MIDAWDEDVVLVDEVMVVPVDHDEKEGREGGRTLDILRRIVLSRPMKGSAMKTLPRRGLRLIDGGDDRLRSSSAQLGRAFSPYTAYTADTSTVCLGVSFKLDLVYVSLSAGCNDMMEVGVLETSEQRWMRSGRTSVTVTF